MNPRAPELLAPAGNWECARAAVANGADAIYFGLPQFNARMRADNFGADDLPELMAFLHSHGVRGFVALNVLVFTGELEAAAAQVDAIASAGVDAVIVQDLGLARIVRARAPGVELHASTQMTITSPEGLAFVDRVLGLDRAVLARELSLGELQRFPPGAVPLEVFVHGALCVAYSGQCLTSEALGQRSANRGECAQACRMPYELVVDGEPRDLGDRRFLLSPQDLAAVDQIPALLERGVVSFKIEGRLKSPEYVAAVTQVYRRALDAAAAGRPRPASPDERYALEMTFSRGLSTGWLEGTNHPRLTHGRFGKKRGALIGEVTATGRDWVEVDRFRTGVKAGDGIVFDVGGDTDAEQGGAVFAVDRQRLRLRRGKVDTAAIPRGAKVWKTADPALAKQLRKSFESAPAAPAEPLDLTVTGGAGEPLAVAAPLHRVRVESLMPLQPARNRPLDDTALRSQLGRLGGTRFALGQLTNALRGEVILPLSELNRLRRELVAALEAGRSVAGASDPASPRTPRADWRTLLPRVAAGPPGATEARPRLSVLCRTPEQVAAAAGLAARIYCDFEDLRRYREAVAEFRAASPAGAEIFLATPRIQKAGEAGFFKLVERAAPDGALVRNLGAVDHFASAGLEMAGDFSLNVANPITAATFIDAGLASLTASYDLDISQLLALLGGAPPRWFEITIHQHMPMFHMEHCVFCTFMSEGTSSRDCGRPCDHHDVQLRDRVGQLHTLRADVGCRNTLFRGQAQSAARFFPQLRDAGACRFRIDLLREGHAEARKLIGLYRDLLDGNLDPDRLFAQLDLESRLGVVEGTLRSAQPAAP